MISAPFEAALIAALALAMAVGLTGEPAESVHLNAAPYLSDYSPLEN